MAVYIADAGPDEVVVYTQRVGAEPEVAARYPLRGTSADNTLDRHGWYRLRVWWAPHEAPDHRVAQVVPH